jgi:hypothetical protein
MKTSNLLNPIYIYKRRDRIVPLLAQHISQWSNRTHRGLNDRGIPVNRNELRLTALRNQYKGERAFIIGNGPSLRMSDLDLIKDEIAFASNKIYLAFDQTAFRPTFYTVIDFAVAENCRDVIAALKLRKIFPAYLQSTLGPDSSAIYFNSDGGNLKGFSGDPLRQGLFGGYTVVFAQLQLAYYLGIQEVFLIGMDHTWNLQSVKQGEDQWNEKILVSQGEQNHFHPDYRKPGEKWTLPRPEAHEIAFKIARDYYEAHGRHVYNATRGGRLEIFDRIDLDGIVRQ